MRISTKGRYGINAMFMLAQKDSGKPISLNKISTVLSIPMPYLEQIIIKLRKNGYIESIRGSKGGYILAKSSDEILIYDLLIVLEGEMAPVHCKNTESCSGSGKNICCAGELVWTKINSAIIDSLDGYTIRDMLDEFNQKN